MYIIILTLRICNQGPPEQHRDHSHLLHSPPSEVEGVRIVVISFRNIAKRKERKRKKENKKKAQKRTLKKSEEVRALRKEIRIKRRRNP